MFIYNLEDGNIHETYYEQQETITAISTDPKLKILVTGSKLG